jgi:hypothetical protein
MKRGVATFADARQQPISRNINLEQSLIFPAFTQSLLMHFNQSVNMHIREFTRSDIPAVSAIAFASLKDDKLYNYLFPSLKQHPEDFHHTCAINLRNRLVRPELHGFVAVTDEDNITGYAFFERVRGAKEDTNAKWWIRDSWLNSK